MEVDFSLLVLVAKVSGRPRELQMPWREVRVVGSGRV